MWGIFQTGRGIYAEGVYLRLALYMNSSSFINLIWANWLNLIPHNFVLP